MNFPDKLEVWRKPAAGSGWDSSALVLDHTFNGRVVPESASVQVKNGSTANYTRGSIFCSDKTDIKSGDQIAWQGKKWLVAGFIVYKPGKPMKIDFISPGG